MTDKASRLGTEKILKLIISFSLPAIVGMIVNAIYNIVDRIFISHYVGEAALGGLTVSFPIMMIMFSVASLISVGAATLISNKLGEGKPDEANRAFGNMITMSIIGGILMSVFMYFCATPILRVAKTSEDLLPLALEYLGIIILVNPLNTLGAGLSSAIRAEGRPIICMISTILAGVTNIILDYIFIGVMQMGVFGAALATAIGECVCLLICIGFYMSKKSMLKFTFKGLLLKWDLVSSICSIGLSAAISSVSTSLSFFVFNFAIGLYASDNYITALGAMNSVHTIIIMPLLGLQQGASPIFGYNYGAKKYDRIKETLKISIILSTVISIASFALFELLPEPLLMPFIDSASPTMKVATQGIRLYSMGFPVVGAVFICTSYLQSTKKALSSLILNIARQFVVLIPLVLLMPLAFGKKGIWLANGVSDYLIGLLAFALAFFALRKDKKNMVIKEEEMIKDIALDITDKNEDDEEISLA